ncbi:hippocampus abundant transcript-like protein 1 [Solanum pennellii]|uniref:Hippocampus abundant transcript-like protein 1 n=1 Tax=Solanum pennellii TaxID=28526 RepID=A0ABM1UXA5_SOLPN|nr:hippocampus abundant transcript-like protein 1 [Solanum pennellii]XP_027768123.1 hippocampus abundant transcript-like protein 1 [Solanum pennellii]
MKMDKLSDLKHLFVTVFLANFALNVIPPAITDITVGALCPSQDECSLAIYLSGFQQAILGLGSMMMLPLLGHLSDIYGRKALLTVPVAASIIPSVILAIGRSTNYFYAYYAVKTFTGMVSDNGIECLSIAYAAANISEEKRVSAIGFVAGIGSAASLLGTMAARFLSTAQIFLVAAISSMIATIYMRIFVKETTGRSDSETLNQPILIDNVAECSQSKSVSQSFKEVLPLKDIFCLLRSSVTLSLATVVAFLNGLGEGGQQTPYLYFLKARLRFNKDNFAVLMLIGYTGAAFGQLFLMPRLAPITGEEAILSLSCIAGFISMLIVSIAWAVWVPYVANLLPIIAFLTRPALQSIVSKQVGPNEQGIAQGCIAGISSFGNILSPLIYTPLTDLFLSEKAPFNYPGFNLFCVGLAWLIALIPSMMIQFGPRNSELKIGDGGSSLDA